MARRRGVLRAIHHAFVFESRHGRAAEIVGWSNALAALVVGAAVYRGLELTLLLALGATVLAFVLLRLALAHRLTLGLAALAGTLSVAAVSGLFAWTLGHAIESYAWAPHVLGIASALGGALAPAWAYASVAAHRRQQVPDSLISPVSGPPSF